MGFLIASTKAAISEPQTAVLAGSVASAMMLILTIWTHQTDWRRLLWAMTLPRTFYVLGAGASYGLIPTTPQMKAVIRREYDAFGMYATEASPRSVLHDRVIGRPRRKPSDFDEMLAEILLRNIPPGAVDFLVQKELYRAPGNVAPPQYAVFDIVGSPATLFNFNLDGLASAFCSHHHIVLEPHGHIDRAWFEGDTYESWCEATMAYDVTLPHITPKVLPSSESPEITQTFAYETARSLFRQSSAMLIIGYSFGNLGGAFDDSASWRFLTELLKLWPRPVFVLSPYPEELTDLVRQDLSTRRVFGVSVYWETLATCLIATAGPCRKLAAVWSDHELRGLMSQYERAVDSR